MKDRKEKRAVVLGGGGSRGSYQIGVWQALLELGLDYHVVTGTSVGALNGALMAQREFAAAYDLWWNMDNTLVMRGVPSDEGTLDSKLEVYRAFIQQMLLKGGVDVSPLEYTIRRVLDEEKLRKSGIEYGIVTVDMTALKPVQLFLAKMPQGTVAEYMMASASCFPAFRPKNVGTTRYIDGGYYDNLPIELACRAKTKVKEIWAVDVDGIGVRRRFHPKAELRLLRCCWDLGDMFTFERDQCRRNILLGYYDAMKEAGRYEGRAYTFRLGSWEKLKAARSGAMEELLEKFLRQLPDAVRQGVEDAAWARMVRAAGRKKEPLEKEDFLPAAAETAGELLELDPARDYSFEEFETALRERLELEIHRREGMELDLAALREEGPAAIAEAASGLKKGLLLLSVLRNLRRCAAGEEGAVLPEVLAMLLPREFLGSLYLLVLPGWRDEAAGD